MKRLFSFSKTTNHAWWMPALCAAAMIGALALASITGAGYGAVLLLVLCPLMHILMHGTAHTGHHNRNDQAHAPLPLLPMPEADDNRRTVSGTDEAT